LSGQAVGENACEDEAGKGHARCCPEMFVGEEHCLRQCTIRGVIRGFPGWRAGESKRVGASRGGLRKAAILMLLQCSGIAFGLKTHHSPQNVARSASFTFMKKDGSCVEGPIAKIEPKAVTITQTAQQPVIIQRGDLLQVSQVQVSQGNSLVFSARSSWADVEAVHLLPRELFLLKLHNGKTIKDRPLSVTADGMVFKRLLWMKTRIAKGQIVTVDYLRMRPESNAFDYFAQEAPAMLFFYPEFYDGLAGLEGRIPVRLYDAVRREDDAVVECSER
jgi:hypothetical protein